MEARKIGNYITVDDAVVSGKPHIAGHRITVQNIVIWHQWMGQSVDEIAGVYGLTLSEVYAALSYYYDNKEWIDRSIQEDEDFIKHLRSKTPSKLAEKLNVPKD